MAKSLLIAFVMAAGCGVESPKDDTAAAGDGKADQSTAVSGVQTLVCSAGPFTEFRAKLDTTGYDPGSGYFDVRNARVVDNYATATLICTGHTLEEIDCIGFWFGIAEHIAEVTTKNTSSGLTASYVSLRGDLVKMSTPPWACTMN